ncbi:MAG: PAS domain S-box protein, partial [bacterium]
IIHDLQVHQLELEIQNHELKRMQSELEQSRDRYLDLYDFSPVGYFAITGEGRILDVNLMGATLLGVPRSKLLQRALGSFVAFEDRDRWRRHLSTTLQQAGSSPGPGKKQSCELMLQRENGATFHVCLESICLEQTAGQEPAGAGPTGAVIRTAMSDITKRVEAERMLRNSEARLRQELESRVRDRTVELQQMNENLRREIEIRKLAEQELSESETRYRTVADFTYDWEYWESPEGVLVYCSPACERITGYAAAELAVGKEMLTQIIHPQDRDNWRQHKCEDRAMPMPRSILFRIHRKDGELRWIEHFCQPITGNQGEFLGVRASNRDVTDRKQAEMDLHLLREALARVARVSTAGQLAASLAHELNQPLTAIYCNADTAERLLARVPPEIEEALAALADITLASERAGRVIQRLRALFTKTIDERSALQLNDVIRETLELLHSEFVLQSVAVQVHLEPALPQILGNRIELQQVVLNLMVNAMEAMSDYEPGQRHLEITTACAGSGEVRAAVRDSGAGIRAEEISRLFEPFFTTKAGGMGMGLVISQYIIEAHDGSLRAANNPDQGATFQITLPIHHVEHL